MISRQTADTGKGTEGGAGRPFAATAAGSAGAITQEEFLLLFQKRSYTYGI
jgi:hypothetical protein